MADMVEVVKKAAMDAVKAGKPTDVAHGTVVGVNPLAIQISQKITLSASQLELCRNVTDYEVEMTVDHVTEERGGGSGESAFQTHNHAYAGRKKFIIHNGLVVGDKVILLREVGGQKYLVLDRAV